MNMMCDLTTQIERHWPAHLKLDFVKSGDKTQMKKMAFKGPLRVQRPFYPEQDVCHVYLLHPPGGLVSGDDLHIDIQCQQGSHVLITTPSAGKIYQADSNRIKQLQNVDIEVSNGVCEWLPMETIVFDGAQGQLTTNIQLHGEAKYIGIDVFCLGRPKSELPFKSGSISQKLSIYLNHRPLLLERQVLSANDPLLNAVSGFDGHLVSGTLTVVGFEYGEKVVAPLREYMTATSEGVLSITYRLDVLLVRYLGDCSEEAQRLLRSCWAFLRPLLLERPACYPRIWYT